jgi:hypothetical protein
VCTCCSSSISTWALSAGAANACAVHTQGSGQFRLACSCRVLRTSKDGERIQLGGGFAAGVEHAADGLAPERRQVKAHIALTQLLPAQLAPDGCRALHCWQPLLHMAQPNG